MCSPGGTNKYPIHLADVCGVGEASGWWLEQLLELWLGGWARRSNEATLPIARLPTTCHLPLASCHLALPWTEVKEPVPIVTSSSLHQSFPGDVMH
jgi:hypothetical protein